MAWRVEFLPEAERDLRKLDKPVRRRILLFLDERIVRGSDPRSIGEALTGPDLGRYWKYRVGDYRIVTRIDDRIVRVLIVRVGHRRDVYR